MRGPRALAWLRLALLGLISAVHLMFGDWERRSIREACVQTGQADASRDKRALGHGIIV